MTSFIEECYLSRLKFRPDGEAHAIKWGADKSCYTSCTSTTVFDFQHFSMHDESHSISILKYIELLLGRDRIQEHMGVGDLWLLLQCAYFHDIGMTLTRDEMEELWTASKDFKQHIRSRLQDGSFGGNKEMFQAASLYQTVDDLLNDRKAIDLLDETVAIPQDNWPVELCTKLRLLVTDYIRRHHAERSQEFFEKILQKDKLFFDGVVDRRLYRLVADLSSQHTKSFDTLLKFPYEEIAFGDEYVHPRFIAALLRIGDVLDMDNNRFNVRVLEHHGMLPELSRLHLKKHHALTHFNISPQAIYAEAFSNELGVCQEARTWFNWVEEEERNLVYNWNRIAPPDMLQCHLRKCDMTVWLKNDKFTSKNIYHFNFDSRKMHKLLIGDSIYDCRLDCLREYLQNAIDASKVQLWKNLQMENAEFLLRSSSKKWSMDELLPCDFKEEAFMQLPIEVSISLKSGGESFENDLIHITIRDYGIGMDEECIRGITTIGQGWRSREAYTDVFESAPHWMKPTGGFGIGIQSAFMVTSQVNYTTRSVSEPTGHHIELVSPSQGGRVSRLADNSILHGTEVSFDIDAFKFLDPVSLRLPEELNQRVRTEIQRSGYSYFTTRMIFETAAAVCEQYILSQIPNSIFPIYFRKGDQSRQLISAPMFYQPTVTDLKMHPFQLAEGKLYKYSSHIIVNGDLENGATGSRIILWSRDNMDCAMFTFWDDNFQRESKSTVAFKNVIVPKACNRFPLSNVDYHFDVMGERANQSLQVSRASFTREFENVFQWRCRQYLRVSLDILIPKYIEKKKEEAAAYPPDEEMSAPLLPTLSVKSDFARMLFCRLALSASSSEKEFGLKDQLLEVKDWGLGVLDWIWTIREGISDAAGTRFQRVKHSDSNAVCEFIQWMDRAKQEDGGTFILFVFSQSKPDDFDEKELLWKLDPSKLPEIPLTDAELAGLCQQLELERHDAEQNDIIDGLKQSILNELCRDGESQRFLFPNGWQRCFSSLCLDTYETSAVVIGKIVWDNDPPLPPEYLTAFLYTPKEQERTMASESDSTPTPNDNWTYVQFVPDDEALKEEYPELMVTALPCEVPFGSEYQWVHLLLGDVVINKLEKEFNKGRALKRLSEKDIRTALREIPEFVRLTKWTYQHQAKAEGEAYLKYRTIENAYIRWVTEKLKERLRGA